MAKLPQHHVLSFIHDKDFSCALTALVDGAWYHVTADPKRFNDRSKRGKKLAAEYRRLLGIVKASEGAEDIDGTAPLFVQGDETVSSSDNDERDSAVDVSTPSEEDEEEEEHEGEPGSALERWMLKPLKHALSQPSSKRKEDAKRTVQDWYHCPKHYFDLYVKDGKLQAEENESPSTHVQQRLEFLLPSMPVPKYIRKLEIPAIDAKDLIILQESSDPAPIHPTRVRHSDGKEYFLKLVDPHQYQPTKREIQVMKKIESEGLQNELRVPLLQGLVHFSDSSKTHIMGFIMDAIDEPTPLTLLIDSDVDEVKRLAWAEEAARMVDVLHQHGIVWGDAKGDNFMVDANEDLWIIDFGGSYTEGWVDPELKETEDGDDMGVRKICNGLTDPENNTIQEDEEENAEEAETEAEQDEDDPNQDETYEEEGQPTAQKPSRPSPKATTTTTTQQSKSESPSTKHNTKDTQHESRSKRKRKAAADDDDDDNQDNSNAPSHKQRKKASPTTTRSTTENTPNSTDAEPVYCYCQRPSSGRMIGCDGAECATEWFHFDCVGLAEEPVDKQWFCEECAAS